MVTQETKCNTVFSREHDEASNTNDHLWFKTTTLAVKIGGAKHASIFKMAPPNGFSASRLSGS
ncbi:hypothetical protein AJ80_00058 [Polytolypa hystricis UAMH7299]|uniref:Uncharacterized protein n=1 Tax=Polytolypa hystricis (strain UAMH7299) TaxID=1447883 RepID=A0A2B7Z4W1_POLH7|nr:hypothetical protein AJ80_00058 [Polytolypa hystricis UAMH7299]